jgi:hypothetical protein
VDSVPYNIGIRVNGYYTRFNSAEFTTVVVSKPIATNFITGGGYYISSDSAGKYTSAPNEKNNFGFNVKYNKALTNLQGSINLIIRNKEASDNKVHVHLVKGNVISSLVVTLPKVGPVSPNNPAIATVTGKANIQDITDYNLPVSEGGNAQWQMTIADGGDAGTADKIGFTLRDNSNNLLYSSSWTGTKTVDKLISGGNIVIH